MDGSPHTGRPVAWEVNFELSVTITAVLETKRLEFMIALNQVHVVCLHMSPQISWCMLSTVDTDEATFAVVGVHTEMIYAGIVTRKGNPYMETYIGIRAT